MLEKQKRLKDYIGEEEYKSFYEEVKSIQIFGIPFDNLNPEEIQVLIGFIWKNGCSICRREKNAI